MTIERKETLAELKELNENGEGVLRFIKFHEEDKDFDITFPGFVQRQKAILISAHNWKSDYPPLGFGESFEDAESTNFRFRMNLTDERAKSWYSWLKLDQEYNKLQQVSYGFLPHADATERWQKNGRSGRYLRPRADGSPGAKLIEISFVTLGSGSDTAILDLKEDTALNTPPHPDLGSQSPKVADVAAGSSSDAKRIIGPHSTPTDDRPWNFAIEHRQVKAAMPGGFYRNLFAVQDPGNESHRKHYRYLHHRITAEGFAGPASIVACAQILHALHKGLIPPDERAGVYAHMAQHLKDAGIEPPALGDGDSYVYPYDEETKLFLWHVDDILLQTGNLHHWRARKGLALTQARLDQFQVMDQKWTALRLLLSVKGLDRPYDEVVDAMTVEARGEAMVERLREVVEHTQRQAETANRTMTETFVSRLVEKLA